MNNKIIRKIIVTGSSGTIGTRLCEKFLDDSEILNRIMAGEIRLNAPDRVRV